MSIHAVKAYQREVEEDRRFGGSNNELSIRDAFKNMLNEYARPKGLRLIYELPFKTQQGKSVKPDGTLKDSLQNSWGFWESKDEADDINEEIQKKFAKGYPNDNILFEDSRTSVLYQHGAEVLRCDMADAEALHELITKFINYERPEVKSFREAIEAFKQHIPHVTEALRSIIEQQAENPAYVSKRAAFLELCKEAINPDVAVDDVREMLIQHILTADIFNTIFDEPHFHRENNVAKELEEVLNTFFTGTLRRQTLDSIKHYYDVINARAAEIADHHEKQKFLKVVYETFYKSYNPKAADRLGVVYTPNEIVRFMVESTDYLLNQHFGKFLEDRGVDILDPATGTGTFICDIIDYISPHKLEFKYKEELHANEVAILPYYISNLNIEFTYKQRMKQYEEFQNLCFMDTLDNLGFKRARQNDLFNPFTEENSKRIMRQNAKKISVVIGNPPYNANQQNENDNNKNREYPEIDQRIKDTFIYNSTAQKTKVYDMYSRFYRWAIDRIQDNGVIAFITNRSFIDKRTFDGFRKTIQDEFDNAYIIDTKSDVRDNPKISGTKHNVFGIQTGVAVMFLVRKESKKKKRNCDIRYVTMDDFWTADQKLQWFTEHKINTIQFEHITPDNKNSWIELVDNDWETLTSLFLKNTSKRVFSTAFMGISTNRDEWVYDFNKKELQSKIHFFIERYNELKTSLNKTFPDDIKWSRDLKIKFNRGIAPLYNNDDFINISYRPFTNKYFFKNSILVDRLTQNHINLLPVDKNDCNYTIAVNHTSSKDFNILATKDLLDLHYNGDSVCISLYSYDEFGNRQDNITDWGLQQFHKQYKDKSITKEDIFHYVYGVLHNPVYRKTYALNLKRDFPRIPFHDDFQQWADWGKQLMDLHINYETVAAYPLVILNKVKDMPNDNPADASLALGMTPKTKLKANREKGEVELDEHTSLNGIPPEAWEYKLGNRSALEWILDQYKEKKPKDKTIAEKFNTYRFADYKEQVIDLIQRVTTVSVETMKIIDEMSK